MPALSFRLMLWYMRNKTAFTRPGFEAASKNFNPSDLSPADLSFNANKSVLVTGANSGIGLSCALECARRGAVVHMLCRSEERGKEALKDIITETGNKNVFLHVVAMDDLQGIVGFARKFTEDHASLDVLINNAGCMVHEKKLTSDGVEYNFAVNTLGTYVLTLHLMKALSHSPQGRVITVSSGGMLLEKLDHADFNSDTHVPFKGDEAYSRQKRQQVVMMSKLAERFAGSTVKFYSMHPGWADTAAFKDALPDFYTKMKDQLRTPYQGADTAIWLALAKEVPTSFNGQFLQDRIPVPQHLPLVWTKSTAQEEELFMKNLDAILEKLKLTA